METNKFVKSPVTFNSFFRPGKESVRFISEVYIRSLKREKQQQQLAQKNLGVALQQIF